MVSTSKIWPYFRQIQESSGQAQWTLCVLQEQLHALDEDPSKNSGNKLISRKDSGCHSSSNVQPNLLHTLESNLSRTTSQKGFHIFHCLRNCGVIRENRNKWYLRFIRSRFALFPPSTGSSPCTPFSSYGLLPQSALHSEPQWQHLRLLL